jgi:hypothetical protein
MKYSSSGFRTDFEESDPYNALGGRCRTKKSWLDRETKWDRCSAEKRQRSEEISISRPKIWDDVQSGAETRISSPPASPTYSKL